MKVFITGSFLYSLENFVEEEISTEYGDVQWLRGIIEGEEVILLPRHGKNHKNLPNHINYLANFAAIEKISPELVISFSVAGALQEKISLSSPFIPNDFFFPDNRLPDGKICSVFQKPGEDQKRGHLIPITSYFHTQIQSDLAEIFPQNFSGQYVHSYGPRFNSTAEVKFFQNSGGGVVSQTCGPEIVLANELQIPFGMLCFTVDYANGVSKNATSIEELNKNLQKSSKIFIQAIAGIITKNNTYLPQNFLYEL